MWIKTYKVRYISYVLMFSKMQILCFICAYKLYYSVHQLMCESVLVINYSFQGPNDLLFQGPNDL